MAFQHILVATDLSRISLRALKVAGGLAEKLGAKLTVLYVIDDRGLTSGFTQLDAYVDVNEIVAGLEKEAQEGLPKFIAEAGLSEGVVTDHAIAQGRPVDLIIETARERKVDLVVLGTHGRSGFSRLFFGSVAEKVVRLADRPVLTVGPAPQADAPA